MCLVILVVLLKGITLTTQSPKSPGGPTMPRRCQLDDLPKPILHLRAPEHKGFAGCLHIALRKVTRGTRGFRPGMCGGYLVSTSDECQPSVEEGGGTQ